jgi:8-oxo-dGTP diphosphatase
VVSVAYLALLPDLPTAKAGSDAAGARWTALPVGALAFDHDEILAGGVERARAKLEYTPLAAAFCPPEFTIAELRTVYEAVWGTRLDPRNFHRKVTTTPGFVVSTGQRRAQPMGRPAEVFRRGDADVLHPPLLRRD